MKLFKEIDYRILGCKKELCTVLCRADERKTLIINAESAGYRRKDHPISSDRSYTFGYGLEQFDIFYIGKNAYEVVYQIPCFSLTEYYLIPLDKCIQKRAWEKYILREGEKWVCEDVEMIYRIAISVFEENIFSPENREWIIGHKAILKEEIFDGMAKKVFFGYKDRLIERILAKDFDDIYLDYLKYTDY